MKNVLLLLIWQISIPLLAEDSAQDWLKQARSAKTFDQRKEALERSKDFDRIAVENLLAKYLENRQEKAFATQLEKHLPKPNHALYGADAFFVIAMFEEDELYREALKELIIKNPTRGFKLAASLMIDPGKTPRSQVIRLISAIVLKESNREELMVALSEVLEHSSRLIEERQFEMLEFVVGKVLDIHSKSENPQLVAERVQEGLERLILLIREEPRAKQVFDTSVWTYDLLYPKSTFLTGYSNRMEDTSFGRGFFSAGFIKGFAGLHFSLDLLNHQFNETKEQFLKQVEVNDNR